MRTRVWLTGVLVVALLVAACGAPARPRVTLRAPTVARHGQSATGSVHPPGWGRPAPALEGLSPATVRTLRMFDSVSLSALPARPFAAAGYTSGWWPTYLPLRRRFPRAHAVSIAVNASHHADCLDVEPGDATPGQVVAWIAADRRAGFKRPCVYSSYWEFTSRIRPLLARARIPRRSILEWDADYVGFPRLDAGFDATQWTDTCMNRNLDCSQVTPVFLRFAVPPLMPPPPRPPVCEHHRMTRAKCRALKRLVARDQRALAATVRARRRVIAGMRATRCERPYRRARCVNGGRALRALDQRARWFAARVEQLKREL